MTRGGYLRSRGWTKSNVGGYPWVHARHPRSYFEKQEAFREQAQVDADRIAKLEAALEAVEKSTCDPAVTRIVADALEGKT